MLLGAAEGAGRIYEVVLASYTQRGGEENEGMKEGREGGRSERRPKLPTSHTRCEGHRVDCLQAGQSVKSHT